MRQRDHTGTGSGGDAPRARPRVTGRALVLVLVLGLLAVSYASSMQAYLTQRSQIADLKAEIARREASIDALEREKRRWSDEAYVRQQARARLGYLTPGETGFVVLGKDGEPLGEESELSNPQDASRPVPEAWYADFWETVELAGNPPPPSERGPARWLDAPEPDQ